MKVEGLPLDRPRCQHCARPIGYFSDSERSHEVPSRIVRRVFRFWKGYGQVVDGVPRWCTLRCALAFANAAHRAGYRMQRRAS
jgi:hypothetical protein